MTNRITNIQAKPPLALHQRLDDAMQHRHHMTIDAISDDDYQQAMASFRDLLLDEAWIPEVVIDSIAAQVADTISDDIDATHDKETP